MTRFPLPRVRSLRTRLLIQILPVVALAVIAMTAVAVKVASTGRICIRRRVRSERTRGSGT